MYVTMTIVYSRKYESYMEYMRDFTTQYFQYIQKTHYVVLQVVHIRS